MKKIMEILVVLVFLVGTVFAMENRNPTNSQEEIINVQIENSEETKETVMETTNKKANLFEKICYFFKCAFADMKESTKAQHELDKANFEAAKAEARANFEENRFSAGSLRLSSYRTIGSAVGARTDQLGVSSQLRLGAAG